MDLTGRQKRTIAGGVLLCALTLLGFWRVLQNGFINYDDGDYVTANPHVLTGLRWQNVLWSFSATRASNWNPLTWLSHMMDVQLFGLNPHGHHLSSLVLHLINVLLLFLLLQKLTGTFWRSFFVAAFFAIHPLHVESVAWVSERKDLLSTFFLLLTIGAYAAYGRRRSGEASGGSAPGQPQVRLLYGLTLAFYALGLMCKPILVTVPVLLLLLDYWPLARMQPANPGRIIRVLIVEKAPFFALSAGSILVTFLAQNHAYSALGGLPLQMRAATAVTSCLKYLARTVWPSNLSIFYPDPNARYFAPNLSSVYPASEQWPAWRIGLGVLFLVALSLLVWMRRRKEPWMFAGWAWFLITLAPVIGLVQAGVQVLADRYTYIPLIGLFIMVVWSGGLLAARFPQGRIWLGLAGALLLAVCTWLTVRQVGFWRDNRTLFAHALAVTSRNPLAEWMVGADCAQQGKLGLAQTHFRLALEANPYQVEARSALGSLFELEGRPELATNEYGTTLRLKPQDEFARIHLAGTLRKLGQTNEALHEYETAVHWNPDSVDANYQCGALLLELGQLDRAAPFLQKAVSLNPSHADTLLCIADLRSQQGLFTQAADALQQLTLLYPTNSELRVNLGSFLWKAGRQQESLAAYRAALRLSPSQPIVHYDLGTALLALGKAAEASLEFQQALQLNPGYAEAANGLGRALSKQGQLPEAITAWRYGVRIAPSNAILQVNLASALLQAGITNEANTAFAKAAELRPKLAEDYISEGKTVAARGELKEALMRFNTALCLAPQSPHALSCLAWFLATNPQPELRDGTRALALAQRAVQLGEKQPGCWAALDAASGEVGRFDDAAQAAQKCRDLALAAGDSQAAEQAQERLTLYRQRLPFHLGWGKLN